MCDARCKVGQAHTHTHAHTPFREIKNKKVSVVTCKCVFSEKCVVRSL
jgi:hypothetical protein